MDATRRLWRGRSTRHNEERAPPSAPLLRLRTRFRALFGPWQGADRQCLFCRDGRDYLVDPESVSEHFVSEGDEPMSEGDIDYTLKVVVQAKKLQDRGWDIYYRASS